MLGTKPLFAALATLFVSVAALNSTLTDITTTTFTKTTTNTTTTPPHICIAGSPCSERSDCVAVGNGHVCQCKKHFSGEDSVDGDGCLRTSLSTINNDGEAKGLHISVGQGADVFVQAGGELRGRRTSVFALVDSLEALLEETGVNAVAIARDRADAEEARAALDNRISGALQRLSDDVQALVSDEITAAKTTIAANTAAIQQENSRATAAETGIFAAIQRETAIVLQAVAQEASRAAAAEATVGNIAGAAGALALQADMMAKTTTADLKVANARVSGKGPRLRGGGKDEGSW